MGKESQIDLLKLSPLAQQKIQELVAVLAEEGFGDGGRPPKDTDFATIEEFGHQAGRRVARALDERLTERHAEHFQQFQSCPACRALSDSTDPAKERSLQTRDGTVTLAPSLPSIARLVSGLFFPQRHSLKLDGCSYSPCVLEKVITVSAHVPSYQLGSKILEVVGEIQIAGNSIS